MPASTLEAIPPQLLTGLALGALFTVVAASLFALGERWFPSARAGPGGGGGTGDRRTYSSEGRRRTEIRDYLDAVGERYAEDHPVGGESVAFYLPERDVAVTFDAHAFFRIRNVTDTYAILVEHELPGSRLGARLPFEVPEPDPASVPGSGRPDGQIRETVRRAHEALGVSTTASTEEITAAYRERVKEVHPDHGGDEASFRRVREAYVTAKEHAD